MNYCNDVYTKWDDEHDKKQYGHLQLPHHNDDDTTYTKWNHDQEGKKIMRNYHCTTILPTQNETKNKKEKHYGHLPKCDCHTTMIIGFAYTNETMNKKEKNDGHLPSHDHCTTMMINYV